MKFFDQTVSGIIQTVIIAILGVIAAAIVRHIRFPKPSEDAAEKMSVEISRQLRQMLQFIGVISLAFFIFIKLVGSARVSVHVVMWFLIVFEMTAGAWAFSFDRAPKHQEVGEKGYKIVKHVLSAVGVFMLCWTLSFFVRVAYFNPGLSGLSHHGAPQAQENVSAPQAG